jgi:hypothetical protein
MSEQTPITVNGQQAALLYSALVAAIAVAETRMKLKSAEDFKDAIAFQISAYKAEAIRLAMAFPELRV